MLDTLSIIVDKQRCLMFSLRRDSKSYIVSNVFAAYSLYTLASGD